MAYPPQYGQMEPGGDTGLLPTPGDMSYQQTALAAYPPPQAYEQQQQLGLYISQIIHVTCVILCLTKVAQFCYKKATY